MSFVALASHIRSLTPRMVEKFLVRGHVLRRAEQYTGEGRIERVWAEGGALKANVTGTSSAPYQCVLRLEGGELEAQCSCPYAHGVCWHAGAVLLTLLREPEKLDALIAAAAGGEPGPAAGADETADSGAVGAPGEGAAVLPAPNLERNALSDRLLGWPKVLLADTLAELALRDPLVRARLAERREEPADLDLRLFRQAARAALRPGQRLARYETPRVGADVREIAGSVGRLVTGGHPEAALDLLEEIAQLTWARLEDADDRDGALTAAVRQTLLDWARGWSEVPGRDRQQLARRVFGWLMEDEGRVTAGVVLAARDALGPIGLETLAALLRPLLAARREAAPRGFADDEAALDPFAERVRAALRETAEARGDLDEFLRHCDGEGAHGMDLLAAARRLATEGQFEEALRWTERGLRRARGSAHALLLDLRISLLLRQGHRREAIEAAWEGFLAEPGGATYRRLLGAVADPDRLEWRRRALDHAEAGSDATAFVDVAVAASDAERLVHRLDSTAGFVFSATPGTLERAALLLRARHPLSAARICVHLASRLLAAGEARHYDEARSLLESARESFSADGRLAEWQDTLERLGRAHATVRGWFTSA